MRYVIRDKSSPLGREMLIEDDAHAPRFRVHGPIVRLRDELRIDDMDGVEQLWITEPIPSDRRTYELRRGGAQCGQVKVVANGFMLNGFDIDIAGSEHLQARGGMFGPDVTIAGPSGTAARIHWPDRHNIQVDTAAGQDDVLLLGGVIAMSLMTEIWARAGTRNA